MQILKGAVTRIVPALRAYGKQPRDYRCGSRDLRIGVMLNPESFL